MFASAQCLDHYISVQGVGHDDIDDVQITSPCYFAPISRRFGPPETLGAVLCEIKRGIRQPQLDNPGMLRPVEVTDIGPCQAVNPAHHSSTDYAYTDWGINILRGHSKSTPFADWLRASSAPNALKTHWVALPEAAICHP